MGQVFVGSCLATGDRISWDSCERISERGFAVLCWICLAQFTNKNHTTKHATTKFFLSVQTYLYCYQRRAAYGFGEYGFKRRAQWVLLALTECQGESSVSSSQPIICVPKRTHLVCHRTHRVCPGTQWVLSSEAVLSKQYSAAPVSHDVRSGTDRRQDLAILSQKGCCDTATALANYGPGEIEDPRVGAPEQPASAQKCTEVVKTSSHVPLLCLPPTQIITDKDRFLYWRNEWKYRYGIRSLVNQWFNIALLLNKVCPQKKTRNLKRSFWTFCESFPESHLFIFDASWQVENSPSNFHEMLHIWYSNSPKFHPEISQNTSAGMATLTSMIPDEDSSVLKWNTSPSELQKDISKRLNKITVSDLDLQIII